jgi:hypothetical protein
VAPLVKGPNADYSRIQSDLNIFFPRKVAVYCTLPTNFQMNKAGNECVP